MSSLDQTDLDAALVAKAPRISLSDIHNAVEQRYDLTLADAVHSVDPELKAHSICILRMSNGATIIGQSKPARVENYDLVLGRKLAYEDAVRQLWPLMGFALRDRLAGAA